MLGNTILKISILSHSRWKKISETPAKRQIPDWTNSRQYQNVTFIIFESFASAASSALWVGQTDRHFG